MNDNASTACLSCVISAALLLLPAQASAAALPSTGMPGGMIFGYVHQAQVRGEPAASAFGNDPVGGGGTADSQHAANAASSGPASVSTAFTNSIVTQIGVASAACEAVGTAYRTDCLAKELQELVKELPAHGEYAAAREVLAKASSELADLSRQNRDNSQPRLRVTVQDDKKTIRRPVAAVKPETAAATNAKALAVLDEATTVLLRSAEGSSNAALHYQQIAQALNSSKVLLRS
ncbi:hypothetical protein [Leisingera sp. S232]|uniref:hypothetical protein n=1 Tax=Leisingera sp. S232 TaxID=3415132 RepID=UPI003C7E20F8